MNFLTNLRDVGSGEAGGVYAPPPIFWSPPPIFGPNITTGTPRFSDLATSLNLLIDIIQVIEIG